NPIQPHNWDGNKQPVYFDVVADHPRVPLAYYLAYDFECRRKGNPPSELGDLGGPEDGFIQRLGACRDHFTAWHFGTVQGTVEKTLKFAGKSPLPILDWAILDAMCRRGMGIDAKSREVLIAKYTAVADQIGLGYSARYEIAQSHWNSGYFDDAKKLWRKLY